MNSAERAIFNSNQRILRSAQSAREWCKKRDPILFAEVQIEIGDEREDLIADTDPSEYAVKMFDIVAAGYLKFVDGGSMDTHDRYMEILNGKYSSLVRLCSGIPLGLPVWFDGNGPVEEALKRRKEHWEREGYNSVKNSPRKPDTEPINMRRLFVEPILLSKGWSVLDWAKHANVSHATAMDYLDQKTSPTADTRKKLADALNVPVERLP